MRAIVLVIAICLALSPPSASAQAAQPLDPHLAALAARSGAPGLVAAVYRDGRLVNLYTWGGSDCGGHGVVNADAEYEIGSISKSMTAVAVLQLWERRRIDIDGNLGSYLADVPDAWKRVTLRQMLTHTSGIPDYEEAAGYGIYETTPTPQQIFDSVRARPLDFEPGAQWNYSNTNYVLLSLIVQRVTGERYGDYMRERIFAPLQMQHTFEGGYAPRGAVLAAGCKPGDSDDAPRVPVRPIAEASTFGAGGILTTARDWAHWYDALNSGRLLSPASMHAMFTAVRLPDGTNTGYGMGTEVDDFRGEPRRGHSGQTQGFVTDYASFPRRRLAFLILTNVYGSNTAPLMQALQLREMPDLSYNRLPAITPSDAQTVEQTRRALREVILGEGPFDLLDADMQAFASGAEYADQRARVRGPVANMARLEFLRSEAPHNPGPPKLLFRATDAAGVASYFTATWVDGKLHRLRWDEQ